MVGVWNVWQLAVVPGSGLVLPAPGLFVLQSEPMLHKPITLYSSIQAVQLQVLPLEPTYLL